MLAVNPVASVLGVQLAPLPAATTTARAAPASPGARHRAGVDADRVLAGAGGPILFHGSDDLLGPTLLAVALGVAMIALAATLVWGHRRH